MIEINYEYVRTNDIEKKMDKWLNHSNEEGKNNQYLKPSVIEEKKYQTLDYAGIQQETKKSQ